MLSLSRLRRAGRYIIELFLWPHRLMVRTPGFHPGNLSSILGGATRVVVQSGSIRALGARGRRFKSYLPDYARVAQSGVEQVLCKHQVIGSNPISGSRVSYSGNTSAFQADAVGSIPGGGSTTMRVSYSGNTSAFQADAGSSILPTRSKLL